MTTKELTVGTRVRLRSACGERDTGTITSTRFDGEPNRVEVQWDDGRRTAWRADALMPFSPPSGNVPPSERVVVDDTTRELLS